MNLTNLLENRDSDPWQRNIFVRGKNLNLIINEIINSVQRKEDVSERTLCKRLRISRNTLRKARGKNGLMGFRFSLIKKFLKFLQRKEQIKFSKLINEKIEEISYYQSRQWARIPRRITASLAEILGRHAGDGSITKSTHTIALTANNKKFAELSKMDFKNVFGLLAKVRKERTYWMTKINSLALTLIFNKIFGMPIGKKSDTVRIPKIIRESDIICKTAFLRGLIDTDGSVFLNKQGKPVLEIYSNSKQLLLDSQEIIALLGVEAKLNSRMKKGKERYILRVSVNDTIPLLNRIELKNSDKFTILPEPKVVNIRLPTDVAPVVDALG